MRNGVLLRTGLALAALAAVPAVAQEPDAGQSLPETIAALDAALFDAYNECRLEDFRALLADDIEFYHDLSGLQTDPDALIESLKNNICGKVRREVLEDSVEVHRIADLGALQHGVHLFHHPGREEIDGIGQGRFTHLWVRTDDGWRLSRIFSYDHRAWEGPKPSP